MPLPQMILMALGIINFLAFLSSLVYMVIGVRIGDPDRTARGEKITIISLLLLIITVPLAIAYSHFN